LLGASSCQSRSPPPSSPLLDETGRYHSREPPAVEESRARAQPRVGGGQGPVRFAGPAPLPYARTVDLQGIGRLLAGVGVVLIVVGAVLWLAGRVGLGRLPGDIVVRRDSFTFAFPLMTSLLLSLLATLLLNLWAWWRR